MIVVASPADTDSGASMGANPSASTRSLYVPGATSGNANAPSSAASVVAMAVPSSPSSVIVAAATGLSATRARIRPSRRPARGGAGVAGELAAASAPAAASGAAGATLTMG